MLKQQQQEITASAFNEMVQLPENAGKNLEFIFGEIVEKMVADSDCSTITSTITGELYIYLKKNRIGRLTSAEGGYVVGEHRFIPDVAFIRNERDKNAKRIAGYVDSAPDLAVEVISPTDKNRNINLKIEAYKQAGVLLWIVYPEDKEIHVHESGKPLSVFKLNDTLTSGDVLPNFELPLTDIFVETDTEES